MNVCFAAEAAFHKIPDWGMFKLVPRRKNCEITGSLHYIQSAGFVGIFIPVQTHMNFLEIEPVKGFTELFTSYLSHSLQNILQVLRNALR